ncbi:thioredoxin [Malaciobacter molluscorum LMG 25693]|uniref:Thioredoxin n=1 Tax=Malaciobacter molluscorum LMG 25693 TaxID=870501 RepID=A0A2G1DEQ5_9BACT|nr:thioredoxin [Malaciobacter molluscorum]AXX93510.1 thioredoxin [Malaciobacter molluscorum LMG 25693]PHO16971.1 thioredoxin [Malaciobacter molluscorum LMG 25693]RXJ93800.1 thioredoxin [Malaciobacter molluscorum]
MKKFIILLMASVVSVFAFEHINIMNIDEKIKDKTVIVDFYATWCPPCKIMTQNLNKYEKVKNPNVKVYKVDVDKEPELAQKFGIRTIPTLIYFKDGKVVKQEVGIRSVSELQSNVKNLF